MQSVGQLLDLLPFGASLSRQGRLIRVLVYKGSGGSKRYNNLHVVTLMKKQQNLGSILGIPSSKTYVLQGLCLMDLVFQSYDPILTHKCPEKPHFLLTPPVPCLL